MKNIKEYEIFYYNWQIKRLEQEINKLKNKIKLTSCTD